MALSVEELRLMHAAQKKSGVATQVGNHGDSEEGMRRLGEVHPASVEATDLQWGAEGSWTWRNTIHWRFPARKGMDAMTVLIDNVAARAGLKKLEWDGTKVTNDESTNAFLKTTYRPGWEIKG